MASCSDIAHRWANKDFGHNGQLHASNSHCDEQNFYSYSTVIAQWLDKEKNVMAIIDIPLSNSTSSHISAVNSAVRGDTNVFRFHLPPQWRGWRNAELLNFYESFNKEKRMCLVNKYIDDLYEEFKCITTSKDLKGGDLRLHWWSEIIRLNNLYNNDASPKKWLAEKINGCLSPEKRKTVIQKRKMVRALLEKKEPKEIVDIVFGKGVYQAWHDRTEGLRKAAHSREYAIKICNYIGASNGWSRKPLFTYKELKKMSAYQLTVIKHINYWKEQKSYKETQEHQGNAMKRAIAFIGLSNNERYCNGRYKTIVNHFTGEIIYNMENDPYDWRDNIYVDFKESDFKEFCKAPDKFQWLRRFYRICEIKNRRLIGYRLKEEIHRGRLIDSLSPEETHIYNEWIARHEKYRKDSEAESLARQQRVEEQEAARRLKERTEREEKLRKLEVYRAEGIEGLRKIWRDHLGSIPCECESDKEYFYGGNVLLRWKDDGSVIETSKNIRLSVEVCKKCFKVIKQWHDNPVSFRTIRIKTQSSGEYTIESFKDDILTSGCHRIAYDEMERMYHEIMKRTV